jgi:hypothetical protein
MSCSSSAVLPNLLLYNFLFRLFEILSGFVSKPKMSTSTSPSKNNPTIQAVDIISFISELTARSKALLHFPESLLGAVLMRDESWKRVDNKEVDNMTVNHSQ